MKRQMKITVYEAPVTERFQVELEGSFCGSVVKEENNRIDSASQEVEQITLSDEWNTTSGWTQD